jgi:hypothetical protein
VRAYTNVMRILIAVGLEQLLVQIPVMFRESTTTSSTPYEAPGYVRLTPQCFGYFEYVKKIETLL